MLFSYLPGRKMKPDWNNPQCVSINSLSCLSHLLPFPSFRQCFDAVSDYRRYLSDYIVMLNSGWKHMKYNHAFDLPEKINWHDSNMQNTDLPCFFQLIDRNNLLTNRICYASDQQSVHILSKNCTLPHYWSSLRKKLTFASVSSAFHLFINGNPVGYSEMRHQPVSFDITSFWQEGENHIELLLYEECSSSHLRSGWQQQYSAVPGDVYIEAFPAISIADVKINTLARDTSYKAWTLNIEALIASCRISLESPVIRTELYNDYKLIAADETKVQLKPVAADSFTSDVVKTTGTLKCDFYFDDVISWSADNPSIYDLYITISDNRGYEQVSYHLPVGFRSIERRGSTFKSNGKSLILVAAAVCCTDFTDNNMPFTTSAERISKKLIQYKKAGYNCLFLSDGISDPAVFELADMLGLYLIVSTDIRPDPNQVYYHNSCYNNQIDKEIWTNIVKSTCKGLIDTGKTHSSVIAWNIGHNLSSWPQLDSILKHVHELDPNRITLIPAAKSADLDHPSVYYTSSGLKGVFTDDLILAKNYGQYNIPILSMLSEADDQACSHEDQIRGLLEGKLSVIGLINDSCSLNRRAAHSIADNTVAAAARYLSVELENDDSCLCINNLRPFAAFTSLTLSCQSHLDQQWLEAGSLTIDRLEADSSVSLSLADIINMDKYPTHINVEISWTDESWPHQGQHSTTCLSFMLRETDNSILEPPAGRYTPLSHGRLRIEEDKHLLLISGSRFWFIFNRVTGSFESWRCGETELLSSNNIQSSAGPYWHLSGLASSAEPFNSYKCYLAEIKYDCDGTAAVIETRSIISFSLKMNMLAVMRYEINHKGVLKISASIEYPESWQELFTEDNLSLELIFDLSRHLSQIQWYGYGPTSIPNISRQETQLLPHSAANNNWLQIHNEQIDYSMQLWYGAHWLYTGNEHGLGLLFSSDHYFSFAAVLRDSKPNSVDNKQFFNRQYNQLRLEFLNLTSSCFVSDDQHTEAAAAKTTTAAQEKGQSIRVFKRQYTLQPSALNLI